MPETTNPDNSDLACELLITDFNKLYDVNLKATEERMFVMRLAISFISAPFIILTALLSTKVISPENLLKPDKLPPFIFAFIFICGSANIISLIRFIEVTGTHMRTARAINNFRRLYSIMLKDFFEDIKWSPNLPTDPKFPPTFSLVSWAGIIIALFVVVNSIYMTIGIFGYIENNPLSFYGITFFLITAFMQYSLYPLKGKIKRRFNPAPKDEFNFPKVEV
jgi:hypothetical protein